MHLLCMFTQHENYNFRKMNRTETPDPEAGCAGVLIRSYTPSGFLFSEMRMKVRLTCKQ